MQWHDEQISHNDPNMVPHLGLTAEVAFPRDHRSLFVGGELPDAIIPDNNPSPSRVEGPLAEGTESEGVEFLALTEWTNKPQEYPVNNISTNPTLAHVAPEIISASQLSSPDVLSSDSHTVPTARAEDQPFRCSWYTHGLVGQCGHVASNRLAFLRHLCMEHQASGSQDATIICRLFDSKTGSACNTPIKRGNFARHADSHYHVRFYCQHCPPGKSFSRQDSWKKHLKSKHM